MSLNPSLRFRRFTFLSISFLSPLDLSAFNIRLFSPLSPFQIFHFLSDSLLWEILLLLYHCLLFEFSTLDASYVLSRDATLSRPSISHVIARKSVVELERRNECRSKEKEKPCTSPRSIDNINKLYLEVDLTLKGRREREREKIVAREFLRGSRARRAVARYISREDRRRRSMDVGATRFNRDFPIRGEDAPRWGIFPHYGYFTSKSPELIKMGRGLYTTSTLGVWVIL